MTAWTEWISTNEGALIQRLAEAVAIPSISADPAHRKDVVAMASWLAQQLESLSVKVTQVPLGSHTVDGQLLELPPVLLAEIGNDPLLKTILIYGHYDVQPASKGDGWSTEPFVLTEDKEGRLYGRGSLISPLRIALHYLTHCVGSTDDKGPVLAWLNVIEAHQKTNTPLPVNLKMIFEGMEESGSEGLEELVVAESTKFLSNVDAVCISDNYWIGTKTPCLTYGLRGLSYFQVTVSGPSADLHSGQSDTPPESSAKLTNH